MHEMKVPEGTQALIFDIDGTLADSMPVHMRAWHYAAQKLGFRYDEKFLLDSAGASTASIVEEIARRQGLVIDVQAAMQAKRDYFEQHRDDIGGIDKVLDVFHAYLGKLPIGAGTGGGRENATFVLKNIGICHLLDALVTADDVEHPKPSPETFLKCAQQLGVEPAGCLVFEDGNFGLQAAQAAGMAAIDVRPFIPVHDYSA